MTTAALRIGEQGVAPSGPAPSRVESVDLLRGAVMVLMVLDHCRDFFGDPRVNPTDLAVTTPALFFTRWVTHLCAPTFCLLAGLSASLRGARRTRGEMSRYLVTRGLLLILLEQTWEPVFIYFSYPHFLFGIVLWMLGWSMTVLAGLIWLPRAAVGLIAVVMIAGHNLLDGLEASPGFPDLFWGFLHDPGMRTLPGGIPILLGYPLIPWAGVMALGYTLGPLFSLPDRRRRATLLTLGLGSLLGFLLLRLSNFYGDPRPWSRQDSPVLSVLSFLNVTKQPPSLLYLLITLGVAFLALALLDRGLGRVGAPLRLIGQEPLFFYLLQWPVAHGLALLSALARGYPVGWMFEFPGDGCPPGYGDSLAVVYLSWVVTVVVLYYLTRLYWRRRRLAG